MVKIITESLPEKLNDEDVKAFYKELGFRAEYQEPKNWTLIDGSIMRGHLDTAGNIEPSDEPRIVIFGVEEKADIPLPSASTHTEQEKLEAEAQKVNDDFEAKVVAVLIKHGLILKD